MQSVQFHHCSSLLTVLLTTMCLLSAQLTVCNAEVYTVSPLLVPATNCRWFKPSVQLTIGYSVFWLAHFCSSLLPSSAQLIMPDCAFVHFINTSSYLLLSSPMQFPIFCPAHQGKFLYFVHITNASSYILFSSPMQFIYIYTNANYVPLLSSPVQVPVFFSAHQCKSG